MARGKGPMSEADKRAMFASARRSREAVARMPDLPPDQMSEEGCVNLAVGFWELVRHDLACCDRDARAWVEADPGFVVWCDLSNQEPDALRAFLLEKVWGNDAHLRPMRYFGHEAA